MKNIALFIIFTFIITACSKDEQIDMNDFHRMYGSDNDSVGLFLEELSQHKLYFGHQSVGKNIIRGFTQWEDELGVSLEKTESRDFKDTGSIPLVHYRIGQNGNPKSKIDDFVSQMEKVPEDSASVAFFKFCYVDVTADSDVEEVFAYYKDQMYFVKENYPHCQIILITAPLTAVNKGIKAAAKTILGRSIYREVDNVKRYEFNDMLLNELGADFPVFDLAGVEATLPDGSLHTFKYKGDQYPSMPDMYTTDGGHLSEYGSKVVSFNLMAFLSEVLK